MTFVDPFVDLPEELHIEMQSILLPAQQSGLMVERDPVLPTAVGIGIDRGIYRLAVLTHPVTQAKRLAILDPTMSEMTKDEFLALLAALGSEPAPAPPALLGSIFRFDPPPVSMAERQLAALEGIHAILQAPGESRALLDVLVEIKETLVEIKDRLP